MVILCSENDFLGFSPAHSLQKARWSRVPSCLYNASLKIGVKAYHRKAIFLSGLALYTKIHK